VVIFRKWQHQLNWEQMSDMPAEITSYEDDELLPYANAAYKLLFTDLDGLSSEESLVINQTSPIEVDLVAQTQGLLRATALQWPSNNLVDSYGVIRSIDKVNWSTVGTTASSRFSDTKGLADQSQYFYRVLPIQAASELGQSNIVSVATKDLPPPPANITSTGGFVRQIVLNWEQADDEDVGGYIVNRKQPDGSLDRLAKLNRTSITYIDKGGLFSKLEHGTQYDYVLTSYNIHGVQGQASNIISATTKAVPKQVTGLSVKSMDGQVILDWLKNSETDLKNYQVFRGKSCGRTQKKGNVSSDLISFTDTKVEAGKQYCYQVLAVDNDSLQGIKSTGAVISLPEIVTP
jgi:fibronectin type 3 domain-containing protein